MNTKTIFRLLTFGVILLLLLPTLVQDGMFMDGQQYAIVAKNLSHGLGSLWKPFLSETWMKAGSTAFLEHPPLVYWIQSVFFSVFGDHIFTERLFTFATCIATALVIVATWKTVFKENKELVHLSWLPVFLWILIPVVFWSYRNNVQENTVSFLSLAAILCVAKMQIQPSKWLKWTISAAVFIVLSFLAKGLQGVFPLVAFVFLSFAFGGFKSIGNSVKPSIVLWSTIGAIFGILMLFPEVRDTLSFYVSDRLINRIQTEPVVDNKLYSLRKLFLEILPSLGLVLLVFTFSKHKRTDFDLSSRRFKFASFFFLVGLSASLPLMLTSVQRAFYITPAFPYFAIGFAILISEPTARWVQRVAASPLKKSILIVFTALVFLVTSYSVIQNFGGYSRDELELADTYVLGPLLDEEKKVDADASTFDNWPFQFYLLRNFEVAMIKEGRGQQFLITKKGQAPNQQIYKKVEAATQKFDLWVRMK